MDLIEIHCLHGFLGEPSDWNALEAYLVASSSGAVRVVKVPLLADPGLCADDSAEAWAERHNQRLARNPSVPRWLVGYSLGGRLALQALALAPSLWKGAVVVACHPGLAAGPAAKAQRISRRARDARWASRFLEEPWDRLMEQWNSQPVFDGREPPFFREETRFSRGKLAAALWAWSVGRPTDLTERLRAAAKPLLWISGEDDSRYTEIGARMEETLPRCRHVCLRGAAHRVPWESPAQFHAEVSDFISVPRHSTIPAKRVNHVSRNLD